MTTMSYTFTTSHLSPMGEHWQHIAEEWHAYLSCGDMPAWVTGDDAGVCCHTCELVVVDRSHMTPDEAPADETPADEAPADEAPADEAHTFLTGTRREETFTAELTGDGAVTWRDESGAAVPMPPMACEWFARCDRQARTLVAHPILGAVPACARCADKARA